MTPLQVPDLALPAALMDIYARAKAAYMVNDIRGALTLDEELHTRAAAEGCSLGQIVGRRFVGLCQYRLNDLEASRASFEAARSLAQQASEVEQKLLITNHLSATLRRLGHLEDAHSELTRALEEAPVCERPHAHARLLGNLGSLLDELGQRAAADDCYARFEILSRLLGNEHRLANAVGLSARSAELRGDLVTAEAKYREEAALAEKVGDPLRKIAATVHHARLAAHHGRLQEAEEGFRAAVKAAKPSSHKRHVDALEAYGNFLRDRGDLPGAHRNLQAALADCREPEKRANVNHKLALVCHDAGLFGESLEYLMRSVEARAELYRPLRGLRKLAQSRLAELDSLTQQLVDEARQVSRTPDVEVKLAKLVNTVRGDDQAWERIIATPSPLPGSLRQVHQQLAARSDIVWAQRLLPGDHAKLSPQSQALLGRSERSYSSAVDDLARSAHLLALVIERELKARIFDHVPRPGGSSQRSRPTRPWALGDMLQELTATTSIPALRAYVHAHRPLIARVCDAYSEVRPIDGSPALKLVAVRNAVAHGDESTLGSLGRIQVDAIKRYLALEAPEGNTTILQALARLPRMR